MKRIEDIENLSIEELEQAAQGAPVPEGLSERLQSALAAETILQEVEKEPSGALMGEPSFGENGKDDRRRHIWRNSVVASLALAAAIAIGVFVFQPAAPQDTFDDPLLAYAQVEETFQYISSKMSGGVNIVREAGPVAGKPKEIIRKINEK